MNRTDVEDSDLMPPLHELSEADLWAMVEASPDGMLLTDEHGVILFLNSQVEAMFGYDRSDLIGRPVETLLPERCRGVHTAHRTRYRAQPSARAMGSGLDLLACGKDGTEFPVEISLSPVTNCQGLRVVATIRDISERLAVEAHAHAVLHTIDQAHDGVFMFTPDTLCFTYVNRGAVKQLGYTNAELLTMSPLHIKPEFTDATFREILRPLLADEVQSHMFTTVHRCKDGTDIPVEIILEYPPPAGPDRPRMLVAMVRDITERLQIEQAVTDQEARLQVFEDRERLARDLHDIVIQRLFAAGMGLQAAQHLATDPFLATRITETVDQIDQTIAELRSTIFELTNLPTTVAKQLEDRIDQAAIGLGHQPTFSIVGDIETIPPDLLGELLPTLTEALSNVARHAGATETDVGLVVDDRSIVLTVADNGIGIDPVAPRGNGLDNLETRAERVGGGAEIKSSDSQGTILTWEAPLR